MNQAEVAYKKFKRKIASLSREPDLHEEKLDFYQDKFKDAISNDLNTSSMLTLVYDVLKDNDLSDFSKLYLIEDFDKVLSLDLTLIDENEDQEVVDIDVLVKIELRNEAKKNKDFALADKIRDELLESGIRLIDSREGTKYERI